MRRASRGWRGAGGRSARVRGVAPRLEFQTPSAVPDIRNLGGCNCCNQRSEAGAGMSTAIKAVRRDAAANADPLACIDWSCTWGTDESARMFATVRELCGANCSKPILTFEMLA